MLTRFAMTTCLAVAASIASAEDKTQRPRKEIRGPSVGMRMKLEFSKDILGGLATADFAAIEKGGQAMQGLNAVEQFVRGETLGYQAQLKNFEFATNQLLRGAKAKNLDAAAIAYTQMTLSCVSCHKQLRKSAK